MAMKELAYTAKRQLESATQQSFRHAHVHELLAACFGFKSSAALHSHHLLAVLDAKPVIPAEHLLCLNGRLSELGYSHVADSAGAVLLQLIQDRRLGAVSLDEVLASLNGEDWPDQDDWDWEDDEQASPAQSTPRIDLDQVELLMHSLAEVAQRGDAKAHFALVLLYRGDEFEEVEGSEYWHSLLAQGRELTGIELEWALAYKENTSKEERQTFHLQEAARLGYGAAQLELALDAAQEAEAKGDFEGAKRWYTEAASLGDVDAMRALIDEYDEHNLFQNWVWVFLSELLGHDLRESSLRAYHDGGLYADQDYDDDQGGPLYVAGDEGVDLPAISEMQEQEARQLAEQLFRRITQ
ncbi:hypothetical protein DM872_22345 [Pseudomonas taiwanensis]|uniref:hypothetical protein n=1 Tax=Pseudomonas taiwanensis TaxID=470150 RepID=UPI0015BC4B2E|nr:hypothetical protein [Pseudomonas taiwanensis]NWL79593.1 hypothetical protein [Pseudomonas taiwanensis]